MNAADVLWFIRDSKAKVSVRSMFGFQLTFDGVVNNHSEFDTFFCVIDIDPETRGKDVDFRNVWDLFNHGGRFTLYKSGKLVHEFSKCDSRCLDK